MKKEKEEKKYVKFGGEGIGPFTKADNTRFYNPKLPEYIKEINDQESKRDYFSGRKYRSYEVQNGPQIQRRMLQYPGYNSYPNSAMYTPQSTKLSPVTFNEGVRTPVLQYAHPELGVQPARASSEDEERRSDYYNYDNEYSSYDYNRGHSDYDSGRQSQYYDNSLDYYKKDVMNYPYNTYFIKPKPEQPFWMKITESIKDNVQNGLERMQQLTRPVFEPLVEATHKISHNLGFSTGPQKSIQEKVGFVAPGATSVILPALGLVAGGAALGLGAAAVGRFLNPAELRAMQNLHYPNDVLLIMEENLQKARNENSKRLRRSLDDEELSMQMYPYNEEMAKVGEDLRAPHFWTDTPCAKKLFCEVMLRQPEDEITFMEKKMDGLLSRYTFFYIFFACISYC